jgi:hypothetical protein
MMITRVKFIHFILRKIRPDICIFILRIIKIIMLSNGGTDAHGVTAIAQYGNTLIPAKNLALLRGAGLWNPAPTFLQTTDRGPAYSYASMISQIDETKDEDGAFDGANEKWPYGPYSDFDNMNRRPPTVNSDLHPEDTNSWKKPDFKNSRGSDRYQIWAVNATKMQPNPLLNYFFMDDNIEHLQSSMKSIVKEVKNITIGYQDTDKLLTIMLNKYQYAIYGGYLPLTADDTVYPRGTPQGSLIKDGKMSGHSAYWAGLDGIGKSDHDVSCMSLESQISRLNQATIEECVKQILSGIDSYTRYYRDASSLPLPNDRPVMASKKGVNVLQENLGFYSSHDINKDISSYRQRYNII